jgi:hypothetical protein
MIREYCSVHSRGDVVFIQSTGVLYGGLGPTVDAKPLLRITRSEGELALGDAVLIALQASAQPLEGRELDKEEKYKFVCFRSWPQFARGTLGVGVRCDGSRMKIEPMVPDARGALHHEHGRELTATCDPEALGHCVLEGLKLCAELRGEQGAKLLWCSDTEGLSTSRSTHPPRTGMTSAPDEIANSPASVDGEWSGAQSWLALRTGDRSKVLEALAARNFTVKVLEPERGWTVAKGKLPETPDPTLVALLSDLSRKFGEAFYFATYRIVEYHAWAKAREGRVVRAFAYLGESGEVLWNHGTPTAAEIEAGLEPDAVDEWMPDDDTVFAIARAWGIDPAEVPGFLE